MSTYDAFARYYDADFNDHTDDLTFYREMVQRTGGPVLELMCGSGRVLLPLTQGGVQLTGVDMSAAMLDQARERLAAAGVADQVTLVHDDVRRVVFAHKSFRLAIVAINSFMHLETAKDQLAALQQVRQGLARNGLLVIDLFNPDPAQMLREDNRLVLDRSYRLGSAHVQKFVAIDSDVATQTSFVTYVYDETDVEGRLIRRTMEFTMRWLYRYELEHLLVRAGFIVRAIYGSYELDEYTSDSQRLIVVASPDERRA